jgi:phage terminase Nu1 subunit (DNA packaging protein)
VPHPYGLLRAYNAEADNCVRTVKPHSRRASLERLSSAAATIEKLGRTMDIHITSDYHRVRLYEIELTADYLAKVEEEREKLREERERMRDEQAAQREIEREKTRLAKEQAHYQNVLQRLREGEGTPEAIAEIEGKLAEIGVEVDKVISREANIRAGWVYVISNIGGFGDHVVKIGMTRRLEPMDRVRELGDASVPFRFDVHALIFSNDAVTLETQLHNVLQDRKVNQVNTAREFFYATPGEVKEYLRTIAGQHLLEYREEPDAAEWRASGSHRAEDFFPPPLAS